ncbi:MAG: thioredoxin family protein [Candidatus Izemoplasmataceae bacterium]
MKKLFISLLLSTILILAGCSESEEPKSYDKFNHIDHWDQLNDLGDGLTLIYYYSPYCEVCIGIESEVTSQLVKLEDTYTIYLIDDGEIYEQGEQPFETRIPSLFIFENGILIESILGSIPVLDYLDNLTSSS